MLLIADTIYHYASKRTLGNQNSSSQFHAFTHDAITYIYIRAAQR